MGATVFEIAGGSARPPPPPWYKVWVPKGLVQEGLIISTFQLLFFTRKFLDLGYRYCPPKALIMEQMEVKRTHRPSPDGHFETSESERSDSSSGASPSRRGKYCCVPECKSAFYDLNGNPTGISLFKFPLDSRRKRFLTLIKRQENRSPDFFKVTKYTTTICEKHFTNDDIIMSIVSKKKKLKRGAEPSIFTIWPKHMQKMPRKERRPPLERSPLDDFTNVESLMEIETAQVKEDENMQSSLTSVSDLNI